MIPFNLKFKPYLPILGITLVLLMSSCYGVRYRYDADSTRYGLDFTQGSWLMNRVTAPSAIEAALNELAVETFSNYLGDRLSYYWQLNGVFLPATISKTDLSPELLLKIRNETQKEFFINCFGNVLRDDIGGLQLGDIDGYQANESWIVLEVYDLRTQQRIYYQKVIGDVTVEDDNRDVAFAKTANGMIKKGFKKILKKIEKTKVTP